jgi:hypothetical protein
MWGVIADSRVNVPSVKDAIGSVIKAYVDSQTALVVPGVIPYKIEIAETGVLAGYFGLQTGNGVASIVLLQLRPVFDADILAVNQQISTFISSGAFFFDKL